MAQDDVYGNDWRGKEDWFDRLIVEEAAEAVKKMREETAKRHEEERSRPALNPDRS